MRLRECCTKHLEGRQLGREHLRDMSFGDLYNILRSKQDAETAYRCLRRLGFQSSLVLLCVLTPLPCSESPTYCWLFAFDPLQRLSLV